MRFDLKVNKRKLEESGIACKEQRQTQSTLYTFTHSFQVGILYRPMSVIIPAILKTASPAKTSMRKFYSHQQSTTAHSNINVRIFVGQPNTTRKQRAVGKVVADQKKWDATRQWSSLSDPSILDRSAKPKLKPKLINLHDTWTHWSTPYSNARNQRAKERDTTTRTTTGTSKTDQRRFSLLQSFQR